MTLCGNASWKYPVQLTRQNELIGNDREEWNNVTVTWEIQWEKGWFFELWDCRKKLLLKKKKIKAKCKEKNTKLKLNFSYHQMKNITNEGNYWQC